MSYLKSTKQRLDIINDVIDLYSTVCDFSKRWKGAFTLHSGSNFDIILRVDSFEARVVYRDSFSNLATMSFYHDSEESRGATFNNRFFVVEPHQYGMQIHQSKDYTSELYKSIDEMNNTFSTGYMPEEQHFQYSLLFDIPEYEDMYDIHAVMNRAIGTCSFKILFTEFDQLPMEPEQFMQLVKEGIKEKC